MEEFQPQISNFIAHANSTNSLTKQFNQLFKTVAHLNELIQQQQFRTLSLLLLQFINTTNHNGDFQKQLQQTKELVSHYQIRPPQLQLDHLKSIFAERLSNTQQISIPVSPKATTQRVQKVVRKDIQNRSPTPNKRIYIDQLPNKPRSQVGRQRQFNIITNM